MKYWIILVIGAALGAALALRFTPNKNPEKIRVKEGVKNTVPAWQTLPDRKPKGQMDENIKCYLEDPKTSDWQPPAFAYDHGVACLPVKAKVIVLIYDPLLLTGGGTKLTKYLKANDPRKLSQLLCDVVKDCSGGYINYEIVDIIERDAFTKKIDGFKYDEDTFLEARKNNTWHQPDRSDYRAIFEENDLIRRCKEEGITEVWIWGAGGFGYDELAMYIPNRYARFAPTLNPWFYRPYEIPEEIGHTVWVMGFNYECGPDNMIHSYGHRVESILSLVFARGEWEAELYGQDPWNTFTAIPEGGKNPVTAHVGNVHVPPNGDHGYDYANTNKVLSYVNAWHGYPDLSRGRARLIGKEEWEGDQLGYQQWWLRQLPKKPGFTKWGYNNWWVYIANTDEDLPIYIPYDTQEFKLPKEQ